MNPSDRQTHPLVRLRDYRAPAWRMERVDLSFDLDAEQTLVEARLELRQDPERPDAELRLDGSALDLLEIRLDGRDIGTDRYRIEADGLVVCGVRGSAILETRSRIRPIANTAMQGLYLSGALETGFLLSQCEAEGFRHITWSIDRPDVLAPYTVTLRADRERYPVLLAGGGREAAGELDDGRHWVRYVDPQPKPSYLFALVAGRLHSIEDAYTTAEGRRVRLAIWAEAAVLDRCRHAMDCLKAAFLWDEQTYGRSYRLDAFHIVATHDFTMGAMENTGLNIFNSKYLLADPLHATDDDFRHVLAVVGHEYFHNWTGNRVTCRDWFQLSLKEGLTVYREQEFESDLASRTLRRIEDVRSLWRTQFAEDAGPLAHPVRPDQYREINNFYTTTVYDKGAEIVRMLATLLGREGFRRGMDLYFERHDGSAVTVEDFLAALGDANALDLGCWLGWYRQAGTPVLEAHSHYDAERRCLELTLRQHTAATSGQSEKQPLPIPVALAFFDQRGNRLPLQCDDAERLRGDVLLLEEAEATFRFTNLDSSPVTSLLRGYSAPVRLVTSFDARGLAILASHETDGFNRWQAADAMARQAFAQLLAGERGGQPFLEAWICSLRASLAESAIEPATLAEMLTVADLAALAEPLAEIDPDAVFKARLTLETSLARALEPELLESYAALASASAEGTEPAAQARRRLRNRCLQLLCVVDRRHHVLAAAHYTRASCLSDRLGALTCIVHSAASAAPALLEEFAAAYRDDPTVMDKWFAVQATMPSAAALERVCELTGHPAFRWDNPNKVHALLLGLAHRNPIVFHRLDGEGYRFTAAAIRKLDAINPQVAARLATAFGGWQRMEPRRRAVMREEMRRLRTAENLSADVADILGRSLGES
ncbi:aminopeptidase N [Dokdonella immobilis]|uniref:Aminopeptidase N n=1 Tax=Dokdonella immobilis TaxID=578942 RepID=A0A1I4VLA9_9GAMM|nr:aminopeptidase N [Dokdonella immobilis]SFN01967.1 aminopeptidase N [Dokdonella immobilis]